MMEMAHRIFICIPVHNRIELTLKCIDSIKNQTYTNWKIILCDDGSTDGTAEIIEKKFTDVSVLKGNGNLWWTGGINICVKKALDIGKLTDFIFTLNNDTELFENTLENLVKGSEIYHNSLIGAVNLFSRDPSKIEPSAFIKKKVLFFYRFVRANEWEESIKIQPEYRRVELLSGKGVLIPLKLFNEIGLYNNTKLPHYHADTEFSYRAGNRGYKIFISYHAKLLSDVDKTGTGMYSSEDKSLISFIRSFFTIKSTHYLPTLIRYNKLIYPRGTVFHLFISITFIMLGFGKRYIMKLRK